MGEIVKLKLCEMGKMILALYIFSEYKISLKWIFLSIKENW